MQSCPALDEALISLVRCLYFINMKWDPQKFPAVFLSIFLVALFMCSAPQSGITLGLAKILVWTLSLASRLIHRKSSKPWMSILITVVRHSLSWSLMFISSSCRLLLPTRNIYLLLISLTLILHLPSDNLFILARPYLCSFMPHRKLLYVKHAMFQLALRNCWHHCLAAQKLFVWICSPELLCGVCMFSVTTSHSPKRCVVG